MSETGIETTPDYSHTAHTMKRIDAGVDLLLWGVAYLVACAMAIYAVISPT